MEIRFGVAIDKEARTALANQTTADDQSAKAARNCSQYPMKMRFGVGVDKAARKALANQTTADDQSAEAAINCSQ